MQRVWLKILEVTPDERGGEPRVNATMQTVDQSSGQDLDPENRKLLAGGESRKAEASF
jgi:hypothetical protein